MKKKILADFQTCISVPLSKIIPFLKGNLDENQRLITVLNCKCKHV